MNEFDDTTLTEDEQLRFDELFSPSDRLSLTHDWKQALHDAIRAEDPGFSKPTTEGSGEVADVISLDERRRMRDIAPRLLVAAALFVVGGFGIAALVGQGSPTQELVNVPVLAPDLEIGTPTFARLELPDNVVTTTAIDGGILAAAQDPTSGETTLFSTTDGVEWTEGATFPMRNVELDAVGDSWIVAGEDLATLVPVTNADTSHATSVLVVRSADAGATWDTIPFSPDVDDRPFFTQVVTEVSVTQVDDSVLVGYLEESVFDRTAFFIEQNVIGPDDRVIEVFDASNEEAMFSIGPDVFGEIDVLPSEVGMTRDEFNETVDFPTSRLDPRLAVSTNGGSFESVEYPGNVIGLAPVVYAVDGEFVVLSLTGSGGYTTSSLSLAAYGSADGRSWEQIPSKELVRSSETLSDSWTVRSGDDGIPFQALDGSDVFEPIPTPRANLTAISVVPTDFGSAVVWLDLDQLALVDDAAMLVEDGYMIVFDGDEVRVSDPNGVEIANQSLFGIPDGRVVVSVDGDVFIFDEAGELVVEAHSSGVDVSAAFGDSQPDQFISWSTDGSDWKFASLDGLGAGLWQYYATEGGIIGLETLEHDDAVLFEWPAEFVDR